MMLSPANAGFFNGQFRVGINSKLQWLAITKPYQTISLYFDTQLMKRKYRQDAVGIGFAVFNDVAGDSKFSSTQIDLSLSYIKSLNSRNNNFISVGIQPAFTLRSIDYSKLSFDNQYNGSYYDPTTSPNEAFTNHGYNYFDLNAGVNWLYQPSREKSYNAGIGVFHLLMPRQSFFDVSSVRLHNKIIGYFNADFNIAPSVEAIPGLLFMNQGPYLEFLFGSLFKFNKNKFTYNYMSLNAGLYYRTLDALVVVGGFDFKKFTVGVSYDVNLSSLTSASKARGGVELSIVYIYNKNKQNTRKQIPCPIF